MDWYEDDFYNEPSEFDMAVEEFKANLMKSVKEEYVAEMDRLKKENEELQGVKKNFAEIKRDFDLKKRQLESEYQNLKSNVRRERFSELMKDFAVEFYTVASTSKERPKCSECDHQRRIYYKTPSGKDAYERCECAEKIYIYEPMPILLNSFSFRNGEAHAWYKVQTDRSDEWASYYEDSISGRDLITDETQFENIGYSYKTLFKTKELAQKFCDIKNKGNSEEL